MSSESFMFGSYLYISAFWNVMSKYQRVRCSEPFEFVEVFGG